MTELPLPKLHRECSSPALRILHMKIEVLYPGKGGGDRQAKAEVFFLTSGAVTSVEPVEDPGLLFVRNPRAVIDHTDNEAAGGDFRLQDDLAFILRAGASVLIGMTLVRQSISNGII